MIAEGLVFYVKFRVMGFSPLRALTIFVVSQSYNISEAWGNNGYTCTDCQSKRFSSELYETADADMYM